MPKTMHKNIVEIWWFFKELVKHAQTILLMDGDISQRSLKLASSYGQIMYVHNNKNETNTTMRINKDATTFDKALLDNIAEFATRNQTLEYVYNLNNPSKR